MYISWAVFVTEKHVSSAAGDPCGALQRDIHRPRAYALTTGYVFPCFLMHISVRGPTSGRQTEVVPSELQREAAG